MNPNNQLRDKIENILISELDFAADTELKISTEIITNRLEALFKEEFIRLIPKYKIDEKNSDDFMWNLGYNQSVADVRKAIEGIK